MRGSSRQHRNRQTIGLCAVTVLLIGGPRAVARTDIATERGGSLIPSGRVRLVTPTAVLLPTTDPARIVPRFVDRKGSTFLAGWVAVYGGANRNDPVVTVTLQGNSSSSFIDLPEGASQATTVGDRPGRIGRLHDRWIVTWSAFDEGEEDVQAAVIARGLTAGQVTALARRIRVDRHLRRVAVDRPPRGLRRLANGPLSLAELGEQCDPGLNSATVRWAPLTGSFGYGTPWVCLRAWRADDALDLVLRTSITGPVARVRGHTGAVGRLAFAGYAGKGNTAARTWREGGTTLLVTSQGETGADIDRFVKSMRPATETAWRRLIRKATTPPPPERTSTVKSLTGRFATGWWRYAVERRGTSNQAFLTADTMVVPFDARHPFGGSGSVNPALWIGTAWPGPKGTLVHALVDRRARRLVLTFYSGRRVAVQLTDFGPTFGVKAYAAWYCGSVDVTAADSYTAAGRRLAHAQTLPAPFSHDTGGVSEFGPSS